MEENNELSEENLDSVKTDDIKVLQAKIKQLELREKEMMKEKTELENDFGQKRAKFKEMYLQQEEEKKSLEEKNKELQRELDDARSLICVAECEKENEIEGERRRCEEEKASFQHIMDDTLQSAKNMEKEIARLQQLNEKLEEELSEFKNPSGHEGVFSTVTKSLKQKVGGLTGPNAFLGIQSDSTENLEESMRKAQEETEMLRSLVVPLEEEIKALKDKLRSTDNQVQMYEKAFSGLVSGLGSNSLAEMVSGKTPSEMLEHLDDKLMTLSQGLQAEKASRSDLEMYVAVLNTQKTVMQEDMDRLKKELEEVCKLLETEKRDHGALKKTWQMANDQFLEAQRLQFMDLCRMQSVLTPEQLRQVQVKKKKDELALLKEKTLKSVKAKPEQLQVAASVSTNASSVSPLMKRKLTSSPKGLDQTDQAYYGDKTVARSAPENLSFGVTEPIPTSTNELNTSKEAVTPPSRKVKLQRSHSSTDIRELSSSYDDLRKDKLDSSQNPESVSLAGFESLDIVATSSSSPQVQRKSPHSLTQDQVNALADLTPELEARSSLLEGAKADYAPQQMLGKRLVSEEEWQLLEEELTKAREKLSESCSMCHNYELQLQQVQKSEQDHLAERSKLQRAIERLKQDIQKEQAFRKDLEQKYSSATENCEKQVSEVFKQVEDSEKMFNTLKDTYCAYQNEIAEELKRLINQRDQIKQEVDRLNEENDSLLGRNVRTAEDMQRDEIDLPNTAEEMQFEYLKQRDQLIIVLTRKEQVESENLFLRQQLQGDKEMREATELTLNEEIKKMREQAASYNNDLIHERKRIKEMEKVLSKTQEDLSKNTKVLNEIKLELSKVTAAKVTFETESQELKAKVQSLQKDLDNSETVQRDFVKLSQTLQMELEKIRQSVKEVRWQHDDDVRQCNGCEKVFETHKEKHHCNHCGKIFCSNCSSKIVHSGPKKRPFRVCTVCHTLLDHESAPYFSHEPLQRS